MSTEEKLTLIEQWEITIQVANGDWQYIRIEAQPYFDFHAACKQGVAWAEREHRARLISVQKIKRYTS